MKQSLFDTASSLKKVEVKIDGNTIPNEDFVEIELHWEHDSFEVQGIMILKDNTDLNSFFVNWDRKIVNVFVTDLLGENFSRDFYIVKLSEAKGEKANDKMLEISLVDKLSFELKNTYYSKSYSGQTLSQIIDDIWSTFKFDDLYDKKYVQKQFSQTKEVYDGIVVPQDRSLYDFFAYQLDQEGYVWFQQKDAICIKSVREVLPAALQADKSKDFTEDVENPNYGFKILEFSGNYMNFYESLKLPASTNYFYNYDEKIMKTIGNNIEDIYDSLKSANIDEKYIQPTKGKRFVVTEKNLNCDNVLLDTYLHYMENVKLEIFVPGNSKGNRLFEKRNAFFKGSSLHQEGHSEGNTKLQGEFLVFSIYDKILGDKMISKINICRLNNTTSFAQNPAATTTTTAAPTATTAPSIVPTPAVAPAAVVPPVTQPSGATLAA
ncbi:MAG: hypothetical protein JHC39_00350, partial [Lentimicrobium sp.]|nr:hypothetical protein [Lentimicrobium sp.]